MPFLGSTTHAALLGVAAFVTHDRTYLPIAGGGTVWIRTLGMPRISFHVTPNAGGPFAVTLQYATSGVFKVVNYPTAFATGVAYELHLPARWCRLVFPAGLGVTGGQIHFHASGMS